MRLKDGRIISPGLRQMQPAAHTRPPDLPPEESVFSQEALVRTVHETINWFQIGKGVCQGCLLSSDLFSFYTE